MQALTSDRVVSSRVSREGASLSVVLLSLGNRNDLERAVSVLTPSLQRFGAQLVVAREDDEVPMTALSRENLAVSFVRAPKGSNRAQLCDLGMSVATGDIVALRDDVAVSDSEWMECFSSSVRISATDPAKSARHEHSRPELEQHHDSIVPLQLASDVAPGRSLRPAPSSVERREGRMTVASER